MDMVLLLETTMVNLEGSYKIPVAEFFACLRSIYLIVKEN